MRYTIVGQSTEKNAGPRESAAIDHETDLILEIESIPVKSVLASADPPEIQNVDRPGIVSEGDRAKGDDEAGMESATTVIADVGAVIRRM